MATPHQQHDTTTRPVVFYDGACPLCRREIRHYRAIDRAGAVEWLDLHGSGERLRAAGLTHHEAMARLHVIDPEAGLVSGVAAFVAIWRQLPGYRHLASLVSFSGLVRPLDWAYSRFARWRLRRRCADGACQTPSTTRGPAPGPD
jgi:predicted DCC family thiol-disulfide oxidoreductase YuxK